MEARKTLGKIRSGQVFLLLMSLLVTLWIAVARADQSLEHYPIVSLPLKVDGLNLAPYLLYWHDQESRAGFDAALQTLRLGEFVPLPKGSPNLGFLDGGFWFYLELRNPLNYKRQLFLEVDYAVLDAVEVFCFGPNQAPIYYPAGDHVQFDSRPLQVRNFVFPLTLEAAQALECLLHVETSTNILLPLRVYDQLSYIERSHKVERLLGAMYGVAMALLLYNLIQYLLTKKSVFLYFSLHVLGGTTYMTFMDGTLSRFWTGLDLQDIGLPFAICLGVGSAVLFTREFLEMKNTRPWLNHLGNVLVVLSVALAAVSLFIPLKIIHMWAALITLAVCSYLLLIGAIRFVDGHRPARVYLLGFGTVFLVVIWIVLNIFLIRADVRWITYGVNLAWMFELVVLSVVISIRIKSIEQEHVTMNEQMRLIKDESHTKTEFLAKVSHEIRTPMNGMLGLVELIQETPLNKDQKRYINAIQNAGRGLLEVINDVLDLSRIEAGKMELNEAEFGLQDMLSDACSIYEFDARHKGLELGCIIAPGTPLQLIGDNVRIRQILLNTLSNALKYTEKGYVHINVHLTDHIHNDRLVIRFEVEDSGMGIAYEDQARLFQSYSQVNQLGRSNRVSTGLGLAISQQLVQLMGGEMGVKSELGAGSCFWFDIPLAMPEDVSIADRPIVLDLFDGEAVEVRPPVSTQATERQRTQVADDAFNVLLVEDNEINQNVMLEFLKKMGIAPELADNGRAAVEKVQRRSGSYDLILMDCEMPVMDGYEAAVRILKWQKSKGLQATPIIALTAHAMDKHRELALESGMVDFLSKPVSFAQLQRVLSRYLELGAEASNAN
ncbi:hybrid sensor histidine kinase/response regulator [Ketobacter sp.]|uniref:hybrid sensor histidine kinase/response regulator n=1 Tax=Ketobacter sp. TaxID=2083498 RepID=UPI000F22E069|nr:hybrid sensor histidine kinase/response regulator [Ketobacter sp.]RLU01545.1 MAG: hybrid sensor histidine kinase/response regulator [Ketobacter sp.]